MSVFARVLRRAAVPGAAKTVTARPKGVAPSIRWHDGGAPMDAPLQRAARAAFVRRTDEPDEERPARSLRREDADEAQPLRRRDDDADTAEPLHGAAVEEEEDGTASPLRRQDAVDEEAEPMRAQEDEDTAPVRALRREEEHDDGAEPTEHGREEEWEPSALRRSGAADPMGSLPVEPLPAAEDGPEDELPDLRALRRDVGEARPGPGALVTPDLPSDPAVATPGPSETSRFDPPAAVEAPVAPHPYERPRVTIDQIDVVIHETTPAASPSTPSLVDLSRRMRSRYLRRL